MINTKLKIMVIVIIVLLIYYYLNKKEKSDNLEEYFDYGNYANDVSKLNKTKIDKVYNVLSIADIIEVVKLAKNNNKKIIPRGESHSMGGQTIIANGYIIDTKFMNHILGIDINNYTVTVEPGVTWYQLIYYLNIYGFSPKILQSYASFSIGGSVSVNIHGITSDETLQNSILELEIIDCDGNIILCNRELNKDLFSCVIGGYGLFGIITKIKLKFEENASLNMKSYNLNVNNFSEIYEKLICNDKIIIKLARINVTNMEDVSLYTFQKSQDAQTKIISKLNDNPKEMSKVSQLLYKWIFANKDFQRMRYDLEKQMGKPLDVNNDIDEQIITRNSFLYESAKPLAKLYNPLIKVDKTHILQEYFIPNKNNNFIAWMKYLKLVFCNDNNNGINLLNITIRYVLKDDLTVLNYAKTDMYAFVFYYRMSATKSFDEKLKYIHNLLTNKALELDGTFYLPYRHHYSTDQLIKSYPNISKFIAMKKNYDKNEIFSNLWFQQYKLLNGNTILEENTNVYATININTRMVIKDTNININNNSYQLLLRDKIGRIKLSQFLKNIFDLVSPDDLYKFIINTYRTNKIINDQDMFLQIRQYVKMNYNTAITFYNSFTLLNKTTEIVSNCVKELLVKNGINYPLNNYVNLGDSGRYIKSLKNALNINGKIYSINDKYNYFEGVNSNFCSKFIKCDFNEISNIQIKPASVDLITCFIGLHHFKENQLNNLLYFVHNILKPNGIFIVRDHNAQHDLLPLINCAHNIFNAVTGESPQTERNEYRNFKTIEATRILVEKYCLYDTRIYTTQDNDPTENMFICFMKPSDQKNIPFALKSECYKNKNYERSNIQTYLTTPEWFSVDLIKNYGNYLEHTPWYDYPYFEQIMKYWTMLFKSINVGVNKVGIDKCLKSWSYILMNIVIGILLSVVFIQLGLLSVVPYIFYHLPGNNETNTIQMIVNDETFIIKNIDKRIKILNTMNNYYYIELPRYKQFTELLIKMAKANVKIIEIAGATNIQMRIKSSKNINATKIEKLYEYDMDNAKSKDLLINVNVDDLNDIVADSNIIIEHIYDY